MSKRRLRPLSFLALESCRAAGLSQFLPIAFAALGVVTQQVASFSLAVTSLTMALIPVLAVVANRISPLMEGSRALDAALTIQPEPQNRHAIVVGYGRVGQVVCTMLERHGVAYTAADLMQIL